MMNFCNILLVVSKVNFNEFVQQTLSNFDGRLQWFHEGVRFEKIG